MVTYLMDKVPLLLIVEYFFLDFDLHQLREKSYLYFDL
ncbi:hypothetical protein HNQ48_000433 [Melissococcus plutonius]|nr:hypothetical protein [Melissococcus plutonius]